MTHRELLIDEARILVGTSGHVEDYRCDCLGDDGTSRFLVRWFARPTLRICYTVDSLRAEVADASGLAPSS